MSLLEVDDLNTYYGNTQVLRDLSMEVNSGERVALLGRNGAGKTTLMRSVMGLTPPRSGVVRFEGDRIDGRQPFRIARRGIGYVPADRGMFPDLTVEDSIEILLTRGSAWSLERVFDVLPEVEEFASKKCRQLSGGQQRMVSIARAIVLEPDLLLFDEPTEGLAPVVVDEIESIVTDTVSDDVAVLMAEHDVDFVESLADRAYIIERGGVTWQGPMERLRDDEQLVEEYLGLGAEQ